MLVSGKAGALDSYFTWKYCSEEYMTQASSIY